ncbi:hypothetical protein F3Y22_tig00112857pilonHSYRG00195 [Hibiscus syriacus]|uniref:Uncharacterized protein n=1 Tax=Hibiscus syriacus TaxID=106335 RepID=A0A6A2WSC5_HIBSY|nr:hypothetical protein F3Y22_tig00112857pilonHSYRG00195 [Hibiscus syriacus]
MSLHQPLNSSVTNLVSGADSGWVIGGAFFTAQSTLIPLWFIVLTQIIEEYPAELTVIFLYKFSVFYWIRREQRMPLLKMLEKKKVEKKYTTSS